MLHRAFQRHFHGCRTVIGKKQVRHFLRQALAQARGQFLRRVVREARHDHVLHFAGLLCDGFRDARIGVAVQVHPPGRNRIQNAPPVFGVEIDAFRAHHM